MNIETTSVRTRAFVHFILPWIHLKTRHKAQFGMGFSERLIIKDNAVLTILDLTVMSQHKCEQLFLLRGHYCFVSSYRSFDMY